ncbi:universal stress protein [Halorubrum sp. Boch-26]|uniref:universal stress protein n=1 Tax=Halorubrum sp. Boch-26 TaxID=2994426 RepID=UPI0024695FB4|nr:universal stress protein [Halorubrum sp. Boch-26]
MYDVLMGVDNVEDKRAVAQAEAIADLPHAAEETTAHLCHVFQENPEGASVHQLSAVRRAREVLESAGVNCVHHEASGDPATELITAAAEIDANVICVSGRKRRPTGKAFFGSVSQDVILGSDRPVLAVPVPGKE